MEEKKVSPLFVVLKRMVQFFYPKMEVVGRENLPDEPVLMVANHAQMHGPVACELYFPEKRYTWCIGQMMHLKEVPAYAYEDFWSQKPAYCRWFFKLISYAIAPLSVFIMGNANTIGVYKDHRIVSTFRTTVRRLEEGASVVVFPECYDKHNHIVYDFQEGFVEVAKLYYKRTGKELSFVPLYISPYLKKMCLGKPIRFCAEHPMEEERRRICDYLMDEITHIACSLPRHLVVPYPNVSKKDYPYNIEKGAVHENPRC